MGGAEEEWVRAAMTDDTMVVELLVRLHGAPPSPPPPALPLEWTVRQRRSRSVSATTKKLAQSHRASPSTPLSWSGGTSPSGGSGGGGSEDSSRPHSRKLSTAARSKLNGDIEKAISKRSRKKKTLAELKDEENSLLKERRDLKRQIAALRVNLEKQMAKNENLKRIKIELQPLLPDRETAYATEESDRLQPIPPITPPIIPGNAFVIPDLNMPFDDSFPDIFCGVS